MIDKEFEEEYKETLISEVQAELYKLFAYIKELETENELLKREL